MDINARLDRVYRKGIQTGDFRELSGLHEGGVIINPYPANVEKMVS